jgi:argininosuccinate lyase
MVGRAVRRAEALGLPLCELPPVEFQAVSDAFDSDLYAVFDHRRSVEARDSYGGTATGAVRQQIERARAVLHEQV